MRGSLSNAVTNVAKQRISSRNASRMSATDVAKQRMPFGRISSRNASRMSATDVAKQRMPFGRISSRNASRMSATIFIETESERETEWVYWEKSNR
jgi:hypothetical protein